MINLKIPFRRNEHRESRQLAYGKISWTVSLSVTQYVVKIILSTYRFITAQTAWHRCKSTSASWEGNFCWSREM